MSGGQSSASLRPPVADLRDAFARCRQALEEYGQAPTPANRRAWQRKAGALEVVCLAHMPVCLDYIEQLEAQLAANTPTTPAEAVAKCA